jgi:beta-lactamase class D
MMPEEAQILSVQVQNGIPVDDSAKPQVSIIRTVTTGEEFNLEGRFLGTFILDGWFVGHVFEQNEGVEDSRSSRFAEDFREIRQTIAA